eukprot:792065-Pelagomonas_calceolata.AAC.1
MVTTILGMAEVRVGTEHKFCQMRANPLRGSIASACQSRLTTVLGMEEVGVGAERERCQGHPHLPYKWGSLSCVAPATCVEWASAGACK